MLTLLWRSLQSPYTSQSKHYDNLLTSKSDPLKKVAVVDYGASNLKSLCNALDFVEHRYDIVGAEFRLQEYSTLILPGVGNFESAMSNIRANGLEPLIRSAFRSGEHQIIGICLGMQLMFDEGCEAISNLSKQIKGLGLIPGTVKKFDGSEAHANCIVPHVGWTNLAINKNACMNIEIDSHSYYYFVHSYYAECQSDYIQAVSTNGFDFPAIVKSVNAIGLQFHPEKSGATGLRLLSSLLNSSW